VDLTHDAVVLAGGTGRRLGGVLKPQVTVRGRRLLDHVLDATAGARRVVVVAPESVPVPDGVIRTLEDPPHGGPVAGVAAGLAALREPAPAVLVLACDLPGAAGAVPRLLAAAADGITWPGGPRPAGAADRVDGVVVRDRAGREQWLLGVYSAAGLERRLAALAAGGGLRDAPVRALVEDMCLMSLEAPDEAVRDVDTWADRDAVEQ